MSHSRLKSGRSTAALVGRRTPRTVAAGVLAALALSGAALFGAAAPALAHDELIATTVIPHDTTGTAQAFQLSFNNSIIKVGTEIIVTGPDGQNAAEGVPEIEGPAVTQGLVSDLAPGAYTAAWRVVSSDGHPIEGAFGIAIAEDGSGEITGVPGSDGAAPEESTTENNASSAADSDSDSAPMSTTAIVAISVGGALVVAGGATAAIVANRRRAQGMAADQGPSTDS